MEPSCHGLSVVLADALLHHVDPVVPIIPYLPTHGLHSIFGKAAPWVVEAHFAWARRYLGFNITPGDSC